jgi:DNA-binding MarR family transcriptional regulator
MDKDFKNICYKLYATLEKGSQIIAKYNSIPRKYGECKLFPVETHTIQKIGRHGKITTTQLAEEMGKTSSAVSQIIKKLKVHGLVEVEKNPQNNREQFISLNSSGEEIYIEHETLDNLIVEDFATTLQRISQKDLEKYIEIQVRLNIKFEKNLQQLIKSTKY